MPGKIFVNYRRDDERAFAARVRDRLATVFGAGNVFMDVDNLLAGQRFDKELEKALAETDVFLAVMGPRWMELFTARHATGERDYVREEIAGALKRGITVIPVLIEGAKLPRGDDLPEDMRELVLHQKHSVTHEQFGRDIGGLVEAIKFARKAAQAAVPRAPMPVIPWGWIAATSVAVLAMAYVGAYAAGLPVWWPGGAKTVDIALVPNQKQLEDAARKSVEVEAKRKADEAKQKADADARARAAEAERARVAAEQREKLAAEAKQKADAETITPALIERAKDICDQASTTSDLQVLYDLERRSQEHYDLERSGLNAPIAVACIARRKLELQQAADLKAAEAERRSFDEEAARRTPQPGQTFRDCNDGCPEMVVVPAGTFMMGEGINQRSTSIPQRRTSIRQPFAVGKFEVTFEEWEACAAGGGCASNKSPDDRGWRKFRRPVINVSWDDAKEYVSWLSRKTGKTYRLLTEAEWEYAARAGSTTSYSWGDEIGRNNANCDGCGSQWDNKQTAPVGSFKPNGFGLYDMHGNVEEWVEDAYDSSSRVVRGGSWNDVPVLLRASLRYRFHPVGRFNNVGFRVARTL